MHTWNPAPVTTDANADTAAVYGKQKKWIWPAATAAALAIGFILGGQTAQASSPCLQAVVKADQGFDLAIKAFGVIGDGDKAAVPALMADIDPVMDSYWTLSDTCQGTK
jgi:hypothetical protein